MRSRPSTTRFRQNMKTPTNCRTRWMRVSANSRRRSKPSRTGRTSSSPPKSSTPASSSASMARARLQVERGYVRREDETAFVAATTEPESVATPDADGSDQSAPPIQRATITVAGQAGADEEDDDDAIRPLPDRLVTELTAHRTLALRDAVACHPQVAMTALLHKLCVDAFYQTYTPGCLEAGVRHVQLPGPDAGSEGECVREVHRRSACGLERRYADR